MSAAKRAAKWLTDNKTNIDAVVIVEHACGRAYIKGYYIKHSSKTALKTIDLLGLVGVPGYRMAFNAPIGSTAFVLPENKHRYYPYQASPTNKVK